MAFLKICQINWTIEGDVICLNIETFFKFMERESRCGFLLSV